MPPTLEDLALAVLPRPRAGGFFAPHERRAFVAAAEVILRGCPVAVSPEQATDNLEGFLLKGRSRRAWRVRILVNLVEFTPLFLLGRGRFSRLSPAERERVVRERFIGGRYLWAICSKVRHLVYLGAYSDPCADAVVGFIPVPLRSRYRPGKEAVG